MAIDADLNAGLLTSEDAKIEEKKLQKKQIFMVLWTVHQNLSKEMQ